MRFIEYQTEVDQYDSDVPPYGLPGDEQTAQGMLLYQGSLGLSGTAGLLAVDASQVMAAGGHVTDETGEAIVRHLGEVLRQVARIATRVGVTLDEVAATDITTLRDDIG
ncbi:nucleotide pyrophosphohydrolase [Arthrobacter phage Edmundo]|uniref:Uncharacterized protein n=1 Tax=Arthrobacter phage Wheelbite TaxID=2015873 RepID=A0A222ZIY7_9CAUD|nr:MazG-like pyrophosphatase [Arthrobacter phage Wheelbite]ASR84141.1 hypothetical protein SEA_WHEELBITE_50 [Arthrobacter phage Wheelbite]QGJ88123.1 nucleotide pyrophosphohydrolase [Arthrobacter phage Edmundo]